MCGDLSAHGTPNCILCHFGYDNVIGRTLYFAVLITYSCHSAPLSLCLPLLIFRFLPFPMIHISPRRGFTTLSLSAVDERLFAGFLPSYWRLPFFLV